MLLVEDEPVQSPLLRLPTEIRLMILNILLLSSTNTIDTTHTTSSARILPSAPDYHRYEGSRSGSATPTIPANTLKIRAEDPLSYSARRAQHTRSQFKIRSDRFRARCMDTTYHLLSNPSLSTHILLANARIHAEAAELLYSAYVFDFDTHVEAIVPFFTDLTPWARSCVRGIRLVKRALPYDKEFDRAEWSAAVAYIAEHVPVQALSLGVVAGKPGARGWDMVPLYTATDFDYLKQMDGMEWVQDLLAIKSLVSLDVEAVIEHCPPPMSNSMASYVRFSASIDGPFADYMRNAMVH